MYLEVPSLKTDKDTGITTFKTESEIENEIERIVSKSLSKNDIYTTSPSDIMVSPIERGPCPTLFVSMRNDI